MPRTKRRTVKRSTGGDMTLNMTSNVTMANQPKNVKEILDEFESESTVQPKRNNFKSSHV